MFYAILVSPNDSVELGRKCRKFSHKWKESAAKTRGTKEPESATPKRQVARMDISWPPLLRRRTRLLKA